MPTSEISRSTHIAATPEEVWEVLADLPAYGEWNPFVREASGTLSVGEHLAVTIAPAGGRRMSFRPRVLVAERGRELRWLGRVLVPGLLDGEHSFVLEPADLHDGSRGTRLTQAERFSGLLVRLAGRALEVGDDFDAMNAALKDRVEAGATLGR